MLEEKINIKFCEQKIISSKKFNAFEKKYDSLLTQITDINSSINNNFGFTEKINNILLFNYNTEDTINKLNSKIINIQKENKNFITNLEKIFNDIIFPGIKGTNADFLNFRYFKKSDELQMFKEEMENNKLNINNIEKNNIEEGVKNVFCSEDKEIKAIVNNNKKLSKPSSSKKNKTHLLLNTKNSLNNTIENKINRNNIIVNDLLINKKINLSSGEIKNKPDKFNNTDEKAKIMNNSEYFSFIRNKKQKFEKSKSFENVQNIKRLTNHHLIKKNNDSGNLPGKYRYTILNKEKNNNKEIKKIINTDSSKIDCNLNISKKDNIKDNCSLSNIATIKFRKKVIPEYNKNNRNNQTPKSSLSHQKQISNIANSFNSSLIKNYLFNNNNDIVTKSKLNQVLFTNYKFIAPNENINRRAASKLNKDLKSLKIFKAEPNITTLNNFNNLKRRKSRTLILEREEDKKEEGSQFIYNKDFIRSNSNKEMALVNRKNLKRIRKIQLQF